MTLCEDIGSGSGSTDFFFTKNLDQKGENSCNKYLEYTSTLVYKLPI